jgi:hypothetical protein
MMLPFDRSTGAARRAPRICAFTKLVLVLLVIISVATILITPDPSDDVDGLLHHGHSLAFFPFFGRVDQLVRLFLPEVSHEAFKPPPRSADLLELVCTHLC